MAFNLADMVNNRKKPTETENISDTVYRDVFELEPSKENFYSTDPEKLQGLKNSILLFGVMQDVLIEDVDGKDRIISGHCRTMCCRMLVEEGHEEFRKINCKYTKVNLNTEKFPEDKDGKVEQLINKLGIIQANRFREKSDWEKMQEALITEEVIKELRDLVDLQGTTRSMVQATLGTSGTQLERYHAIQKKLSQEFMQEFQNGNINISVARELTDLDEKHQDEALGLYRKNETITLPEVKALKEKQEVGRQIPGQLTLDEAIGRRRPPEDGTVIDVDIQIERFFESLKKSTTERIQRRDKNMSIYMLSIIYNDVRIRNGYLNYQGKSNGILFNPGSGDEKLITWQQLAETLIEKYGKKQKAVKLAPMPEPQKECPYYDANEVFLPDIARMIKVFLEDVYLKMYVGATRRFSAMGAEFAVVQRTKEKDFAFYNEKGEKVCHVSAERMKEEYSKRVVDAADIKKPSETEKKYLDNLTRKLIGDFDEWLKQDFHKRVLNVVTSPDELKEKIGSRRTWWFDTGLGIAHANLFDDYVQIWDESNKCLGNYDWFYLATSIQKMWNEIAMEKAEAAQSKIVEETAENVSESDMSKRCQPAAENADERQQDLDQSEQDLLPEISDLVPDAWPDDLKDIPVPTLENILRYLKKEEKDLEEIKFVAAEESGFPVNVLQKAQMNVAGLRLLRNLISTCLDSDERAKEETSEKLPLPVMKNNDQRKEWLRNYKDWGLWYTDEHIGARYYKYDFANGARLIAEEYDRDTVHSQWVSDNTESYYMHLIGGPEPERKSGIPKWTQHGRYNKFPNSESELVEFLKEVQRESK